MPQVHQQSMTLSPRLSSCTVPLHTLPVAALFVNVFPEMVLPDVHWPELQYSQIPTPALLVMVLPEKVRPTEGPRLF